MDGAVNISNANPPLLQASQQIVETEHLLKCLLEQPNGLARRILAKAGSDPTRLLEATDNFIRRQPRVTGDSQQVKTTHPPAPSLHPLLIASGVSDMDIIWARPSGFRCKLRRRQKEGTQADNGLANAAVLHILAGVAIAPHVILSHVEI